MTPRAPRVTAAELLGHAGKTLHPKVLASIMRDADLSPEDFE
jgi:predicted RNA binding protein YcfA (HicA-like mRNA interferase family)